MASLSNIKNCCESDKTSKSDCTLRWFSRPKISSLGSQYIRTCAGEHLSKTKDSGRQIEKVLWTPSEVCKVRGHCQNGMGLIEIARQMVRLFSSILNLTKMLNCINRSHHVQNSHYNWDFNVHHAQSKVWLSWESFSFKDQPSSSTVAQTDFPVVFFFFPWKKKRILQWVPFGRGNRICFSGMFSIFVLHDKGSIKRHKLKTELSFGWVSLQNVWEVSFKTSCFSPFDKPPVLTGGSFVLQCCLPLWNFVCFLILFCRSRKYLFFTNKTCFSNILTETLMGWFFIGRKGHDPPKPLFYNIYVCFGDDIGFDFCIYFGLPGAYESPRDLLKWRFWFGRFVGRPEFLYSRQAPTWCLCCWSRDNI